MLRKDFGDLIDNGTTGDWSFSPDGTRISIKLPNQPTQWDEVSLPIALVDDGKGWCWDGNREAPTLTPSILICDDGFHKHWHGFLRAGKLETV